MKATVDNIIREIQKGDMADAVAKWMAFIREHDTFTEMEFRKEIRLRLRGISDAALSERLHVLLNGLAVKRKGIGE